MNDAKRTPVFRRRGIWVYAALLLASHVAMVVRDRHAAPMPGQRVVAVQPVEAGERGKGVVEIAYHDVDPGRPAPVVLLLHGSPMRSFDLHSLAASLATNARVLAPDLPGFGRSGRNIDDYSFVSHADYLQQFLSALSITQADVVAYSMGGGPALELAAKDPGIVRSLTLLSSIGVQELELMGDHGLNRALHGCQLAGFWAMKHLVPHFGALDRVALNYSYARQFYDSDQRPLRRDLETFAGPVLILHGQDDALVPVAAAREHHRIVPQSELEVMAGGHILVFRQTGEVAARIAAFLGQVEQGGAITRASATPERLARAAEPFSAQKIERASGVGTAILVALIALATLVSEDLACIGAGLLAAKGMMGYGAAAFASFLGIFVGDLLLFAAGRYIGRPALRRAPLRWFFKEQAIKDSSEWFSERGPVVILLSRFVPGSRLPTYFTAGMLHTSFWKFLGFFFIAGVLWAPLLVWLAMVVGGRLLTLLEEYKFYTIGAAVAVALVVWLIVKVVVPLFSFRGRRLLVSSWKRRTHWEFWPAWAIYPPLLPYIFWLAVKHRGLGTFAASNPGIPGGGGFIGESKSQILGGIKAQEFVARFERVAAALPPDEKVRRVRDFLAARGLAFPVVVKPDWGQRGLGVAVIRDEARLASYFAEKRPDSIVQEFVSGQEFGVFYYRYPDQPRGHILSVTEKRFPFVTGDGRSTLERLILLDGRAVCCAKMFLSRHHDRLHWVPAEGEVVPLTDIGNHARGTIFLDGRWVLTPEMEAAFEKVSRSFDGFHFGRFDVRVPSVEEFRAGRGFKIIELNGATAECTHMYDPQYGFGFAQLTLRNQWRIQFEIGAANRARGIKPPTVLQLARMLVDYEPAREA